MLIGINKIEFFLSESGFVEFYNYQNFEKQEAIKLNEIRKKYSITNPIVTE